VKNYQKIKVADIFNTDYGAYRLLRTRVQKISKDEKFLNYIICPSGEWSEKMKREGITVINVNLSNSLTPTQILKEIKDLKKIFIDFQIDVVHTHTSKVGATGRIAAKRAKVPLIIHQVHGFHFTQFTGIQKKVFEKIESILARYSNIMLFQNIEEYQYCINNKYSQHTKLIYIGNGIPFEEFKDYLTKEKKYNPGEKRIACIARFEDVKNHKMIFSAVEYLIKNIHYNDFELNLYGEGKEENKLKKMAEALNIDEYINFVGSLDRKEIIKEIFNSDLSVLTSYKEGKPRALMESSALGVPVVATDVIGTREVVKDGVTGYLVSLNDYKSFANKMYELLTNEKRWEEFSKNAKEVAKKEFDENNVVNQLKIIYNSVTTQKENPKNKGPII